MKYTEIYYRDVRFTFADLVAEFSKWRCGE